MKARGNNRAAQPEGCATKTVRGAVAAERQSGDWLSQGSSSQVRLYFGSMGD
jgi:hypothetical protein